MAELKSFKQVIKLFDFSIPDMINDIMLGLNDTIIELNQVEQLSEGIDALDVKIITKAGEFQRTGFPYAQKTINIRRAEGLQVDNVDLNFSGVFWNTFKFIKVAKGWKIQVDYNVHGEDIRNNFDSNYQFDGLTPDNLEFLVHQHLIPELDKRIKARLKI